MVITMDGRHQKPLTYKQLFANLSRSSEEEATAAKTEAILAAYLKLRKHFEKPPEQAHMTTWPESLMDLTPQELCKAFEEAQREEYCPTVGVLWKSAQRDRDAIRGAIFTEHWRQFLRAMKKHGWEWSPSMYRIAESTLEKPYGAWEERPAPVLDVNFEFALETAMGCKIQLARKAIIAEHPDFGYVQTSQSGYPEVDSFALAPVHVRASIARA